MPIEFRYVLRIGLGMWFRNRFQIAVIDVECAAVALSGDLAPECEIWQAIVEYSLSAIMKIKLSF